MGKWGLTLLVRKQQIDKIQMRWKAPRESGQVSDNQGAETAVRPLFP